MVEVIKQYVKYAPVLSPWDKSSGYLRPILPQGTKWAQHNEQIGLEVGTWLDRLQLEWVLLTKTTASCKTERINQPSGISACIAFETSVKAPFLDKMFEETDRLAAKEVLTTLPVPQGRFFCWVSDVS